MDIQNQRTLNVLLARYLGAYDGDCRTERQKAKSAILDFVNEKTLESTDKANRHVAKASKARKQQDADFSRQAATINELATQLHEAELGLQKQAKVSIASVFNHSDESVKFDAVRMAMQWLSTKCSTQTNDRNK